MFSGGYQKRSVAWNELSAIPKQFAEILNDVGIATEIDSLIR